jgi:hypothetical protein
MIYVEIILANFALNMIIVEILMVMFKVMNTMYHVPSLKCALINQLNFPFKTFFSNLIKFPMTIMTKKSLSPTP